MMLKLAGRYIMNIVLALDQLLNAVTFGDHDETVSSRLGKLKRANGGRIPIRFPIHKGLAAILDAIDPNHCEDAVEEDEGSNAIFK